MKKQLKGLCLLVCFIIISSFFVSCAGDIETEQYETNPKNQTELSNTSQVAKEKVVRIGVSGTPDLDPAVANTNSSNIAIVNIYDALVFPAGEGVKPRLAETWNISDDGLIYTFKIRQGVLFHSGNELKASDVKYSMDRMLAIGEGYAYLYDGIVDEVNVLGDYEVEFRLKQAHGPFLNSLVRLFILEENLVVQNYQDGPYGENKDFGKNWLITNDAGTGAYVAKEIVQQDYFYATKFNDWFMGWEDNKNHPESFRLIDVREPATVRTMMLNKDLEMTDQWQSSENLRAMSEFDGVDIASYSTYLLYNMYFNTQKAPFDDLNFRRAIASLIDYETVINDIFVGSRLAAGPVSQGVAGAVETDVMTFDIEKAKEFLADSKYGNELDDYPIEILVNSDVPDLEKLALLLQSNCEKVGITLQISKAPWVSIVDRVATKETTPHMLAINSAPAINDAGMYLETRYSSRNAGTWENCEWLESNSLDQMISDALALVDNDSRFESYRDIQKFIVDELYPTAYICDLTERLAYQSSYLKWPLIEGATEDSIPSVLYGFSHVVSEMMLSSEN